MDISNAFWLAKFVGAIIGVVAAVLLLLLRWRNVRMARAAAVLETQINMAKFSPQYTSAEISEAVRGYIEPDCSVTDPANETDLVSYADVRQNLFRVIDKSVTFSTTRRHQLILADSGMGKTSFCLNYFAHFRAKQPKENIALISLAQKDAIRRMKAIERKSSTVLILDALDEDAVAIDNGLDRIYDLLQAAADFRSVIITCRSQFFPNDAAIPTETGVSIVTPRRAGQNASYKLHRLYLSPFEDRQITEYIRSHFPIWSVWNFFRRKAAFGLVATIPELAARPMLLELLPLLVRKKRGSPELFDLYAFMVENWLDREASWIAPANLLEISRRLAVAVHRQQVSGRGDRISLQQLNSEARSVSVEAEDWKHLTTRSLLNRDSAGNFKFAHRSIMEYLFVEAALLGNADCFDVQWTDLMRELFVSWGYTEKGIADVERARQILNLDLQFTGLLPLSQPPAKSSFVSIEDLEWAASRRRVGRGARRSANVMWRKDAVRLASKGGVIELIDLEYNLRWELQDRNSDQGEYRNSKQTIVQMQREMENRLADRLPSYAEFITLLECLEALGQASLIRGNDLYLLGDKLGERRHLVASVGSGVNKSALLSMVDRERSASFTSWKVSVYEAGMFVDPASLNKIEVVPLRVRSPFD